MRGSKFPRAVGGFVPSLALAVAVAAAVTLPTRPAHALRFVFSTDPARPPPPQDVMTAFFTAGRLWSDIFRDDVTVNIQVAFFDFRDDASLPDNALGGTSFDTDNDGYLDAFTYLPGPLSGAPGTYYLAIVNALTQDATSPADMSKLATLQPGPNYSRVVNLTSEHPSSVPHLDNDTRYNNGVLATHANLKALGLRNANDPALDGVIRFNSFVPNWDFDRTNGIATGSRDFVATAAHEIAHVLGFKSEIDVVESLLVGNPTPLSEDYLAASMMDLFRFADDFPNIPDITIDPQPEYFVLSSGQRAVLCNSIALAGECQASHWADNMGLGLMDPTSDNGRINDISANDIELLDVIGWTLHGVRPSSPTNLQAN